MSAEVAIDNDVLIKCSCYDLLEEITTTLGGPGTEGILGLAKYVVRHQLQRRTEIRDRNAAQARFDTFLKRVEEFEPTQDEVNLASRIEEEALLGDLNLDEGESQLCAIVIARGLRLLITGDKRAITSIEKLLPTLPDLNTLEGKLACLEQVVRCLVGRMGASDTRVRVCAEPDMDTALSICFSCSQPGEPLGFDPNDGLESYITNLRDRASTIMCPDNAIETA